MSRLSSISSSPMMVQFAQGAAQQAMQPLANFIAPTVDVPTSVGRFKSYTEKNRFRIPDTLRGLGGRATELSFTATDKTYNCAPHALDYPVDNLESIETAGLENILKEGAVAVAEVSALAHEKSVVDMAVASLVAKPRVWNAAADPVNELDGYILDVVKAARYGSLMGIRIVFGASAFKGLKNHPNIRNRFIVSGPKGAAPLAAPDENEIGGLLIGKPDCKTSFMVYDDAAEGKDADIKFLLDSKILIFACKDQPTRRDPSFMKTFRLMNQWMVPGSYTRDDGRVEVAKYDWSEDVQATNTSAAVLLSVTF